MILIIKSCLKQKEQVKKEIQLEKTIENTIIIYYFNMVVYSHAAHHCRETFLRKLILTFTMLIFK